MKRWLVAIILAQTLVIAILWLGIGREGARGNPRGIGRDPGSASPAPEAPSASGTDLTPAADDGPSTRATRLESEAVVWGKITDRSGAFPRDGFGWVMLRPADGGEARNGQLQAGSYAIAGIAPGRYDAIAAVRGWKTEERAVEIPPGATRIDFTLDALARIAVRFVTPEGASLLAAVQSREPKSVTFGSPVYAVATRMPPPARLPMTEVRSLSPFGVGEWLSSMDGDKLPQGSDGILLVGEFPAHVSAVLKHVVLQTTTLAGPVEELVFTIRPEEVIQNLATVRARFVDSATGTPIAVKHAQASLNDRQSGGGGTALGEDGRVVLEKKMPGLMYLTLWANGYEGFHTYVPIRGGGDLDLGTFRVAPAETVQGQVLDPEGKGVAACRILLRNVEHLSPPQPLTGQYHDQTEGSGFFTVKNAGRAKYLLVANAKGWATHAQILDVPAGGVSGLEIRLQPGVLVSLASKLPRDRHCLLTVVDERGATHASATTQWNWPVSWRLAPGGYRLTVRDDDGVVEEIPFTVGSKPLTLNVGR